jgi:hypothetical protein
MSPAAIRRVRSTGKKPTERPGMTDDDQFLSPDAPRSPGTPDLPDLDVDAEQFLDDQARRAPATPETEPPD